MAKTISTGLESLAIFVLLRGFLLSFDESLNIFYYKDTEKCDIAGMSCSNTTNDRERFEYLRKNLYPKALVGSAQDLFIRVKSTNKGLTNMDRDVLIAACELIEKALHDTQDSNESPSFALRYNAQKAVSMIRAEIEKPSASLHAVSQESKTILPAPTVAPLKWSDRKTFRVEDITDPYLKAKLEADPTLADRMRGFEKEDALEFLDIVYFPYLPKNGGDMTQVDLRGKRGENAAKGLDKTLWDRCYDVCKETNVKFSVYLPDRSSSIDEKISVLDTIDKREIVRLGTTLQRREQRSRTLLQQGS